MKILPYRLDQRVARFTVIDIKTVFVCVKESRLGMETGVVKVQSAHVVRKKVAEMEIINVYTNPTLSNGAYIYIMLQRIIACYDCLRSMYTYDVRVNERS